MRHWIALALLVSALMGCDASAPGGGTPSGAGGASTGQRTASIEVEEACAAATRIESGVEEVTVVSSEAGADAATVVLLAGDRWQCVSSPDGLVSFVSRA